MKRTRITVLLAWCLVSSSGLVGFSAEPSIAALTREASLVKGDAYRSIVAAINDIHDPAAAFRALFDTEELSTEERVIGRVILARLTSEDVFANHQSIIESFREQQQSPRPFGTTPGRLSGILYNFATSGPENKTVDVGQGTRLIGNIRSPHYVQVEKYTDDEIRAGKARNLAARLAILEHFLKFTEEGSVYEQCELVHVIMRLWSPKSHEMRADDIPIYSLLEAVASNESRHPAVRVTAMTHLPTEMRTAERDLMLTVIKSPATSDELLNHRVVRQSISFFKQHDLELLKDLQTDTYWKQVLINEAIGLPAPAPPKSHSNDEVQIDINQ